MGFFQLRRRVAAAAAPSQRRGLHDDPGIHIRRARNGDGIAVAGVLVRLRPARVSIVESLFSGESHVMAQLLAVDRLPADRAVPRAVLCRGRLRHVSQPARRARSLGHRAGIPSCLSLTAALLLCLLLGAALPALPATEKPAHAAARSIARSRTLTQGPEPRQREDRAHAVLGYGTKDAAAQENALAGLAFVDRRSVRLDRASVAQCSLWLVIAGLVGSAHRPHGARLQVRSRAAPHEELHRTHACAGSRHPAGEPAAGHRCRGRARCGIAASNAPRWPAVSRPAVAARARLRSADPRFEHRGRLPDARRAQARSAALEYATRLVRTWQRAIYGGIEHRVAKWRTRCARTSHQHLERPAEAGAPRRSPLAGAPA